MEISTTRNERGPRLWSKVPEITIYFWIVKILTTSMGEATSDYLVFHMNPYAAVLLGAAGLVAALILQLAVPRYIAWVYWLLVVMVSIFGTMAADVIHVVIGIPYLVSTTGFALALAAIFGLWSATEGTLSIHSIVTRRRELFYWATVFATFALGTAAGDMTAATLRLGFFGAGLLFLGLFLVPAIGYWKLGFNDVFAFWFAYVMTRPLGASFADWMVKPASMGGLGHGGGGVPVVLTALIVVFVAYLTLTRIDVERRGGAEPGAVRAPL